MKKIIFAAALIIGSFSLKIADAQIRFNVHLNIGSQPDWGPVGYNHVDYYYLPDIDAYYYVPTHQYVYYENHAWVHRAYLPARYRSYDLYHGYKVVINHPNPWLRNSYYRTTYAHYRGRGGQAVIRDSHHTHYVNRGHDNGHHYGQARHDNGHGRGHDNGHGHSRGHGHH